MMTDTNIADPVAQSKAFDLDLEGKRLPSLDELAKDFRRLRRTSRTLVGIAAVLIVTVAAVVLLAVRANQAVTKAVRVQNVATVTCQTGNDARAAELAVWNYLLSAPSSAPRTPAQEAEVAHFKVYLNTTLAPRNCPALAAGQTPTPTAIPSLTP